MSLDLWMDYIRARFKVEEGQTMAEYGVVLAVIVVVTVAVFAALGTSIKATIQTVVDAL